MWKNTVEPDSPHVAMWRMRIAYWITVSTNTHSEDVIFIAFPQQQCLQERASILRYTYSASRVLNFFNSGDGSSMLSASFAARRPSTYSAVRAAISHFLTTSILFGGISYSQGYRAVSYCYVIFMFTPTICITKCSSW